MVCARRWNTLHREANGRPCSPHTWLTFRIGEDGERMRKTRSGTKWESIRVSKLLRQHRYRGTIVESELFEVVEQRMADIPKYGSRRKREYPLSGAMSCEGCGRHLHGRATGASSARYLADGTRKVYRRDPIRYYACIICDYMLNAERLEKQFFEDIGPLIGDVKLLSNWIAMPPAKKFEQNLTRKDIKTLEAELASSGFQQRRNKLFDLVISGSLNELEFKRQLHRIDDEENEKRSRLAELRDKLEARAPSDRSFEKAERLLASFDTLYEKSAYEQKRQLLAALPECLGGLKVSTEGLSWSHRRH